MATNQSIHWEYQNKAALSRERQEVLGDDVRHMVEQAEALVLDDLSIEITMEDIEADLRYGRD